MLLFTIGFLTYCIVMNIRDRRELLEFERMKDGVWEGGDVGNTTMMEGIRKTVRKSMRPRESRVSFK